MKTNMRAAGVAVCCLSLGACATVVRGPKTAWEVRTSPSGAEVHTTNGLACASTPCLLRVSRKATFTATVSKAGYKPVDVQVTHDISTAGGVALAGNVLIGGLIGVGVDLVTGAGNDLTPNNLTLTLEQSGMKAWREDAGLYAVPTASLYTAGPTASAGWDDAQAAYPVSTAGQGRVVDLRILPGGRAQEERAAF